MLRKSPDCKELYNQVNKGTPGLHDCNYLVIKKGNQGLQDCKYLIAKEIPGLQDYNTRLLRESQYKRTVNTWFGYEGKSKDCSYLIAWSQRNTRIAGLHNLFTKKTQDLGRISEIRTKTT